MREKKQKIKSSTHEMPLFIEGKRRNKKVYLSMLLFVKRNMEG